ncbi:MAG: adenylate/guanylate cyclase domain-containing protein [Leptospira sp.]|nr:adenylate/guanylate cyclase domain-containing protein [Leptospira sp.]
MKNPRKKLYDRLVAIGTQLLNEQENRRVRLVNILALFGILINICYILIFSYLSWHNPVILNLIALIGYVFAIVFNRLGLNRLSPIHFCIVVTIHMTLLTILFLGKQSAAHFYLLIIPCLSFLIFHPKDKLWIYIVGILSISSLLYCEYFADVSSWLLPISEVNLRFLHFTAIAGTSFLLTKVVSIFSKDIQVAQNKLKKEHARSEQLLLNILPEPIARRLKIQEEVIADNYQSATILFADIIGFTQFSSGISPHELVSVLNIYFTEFDRLSRLHEIEKIKTIGDSYMVASGIPIPSERHAEKIIHFAISIIKATREISSRLGQDISIRVGVNSGPVTAGVIGKEKFAYDLWGDAVNLASRMESSGIANHIQITEASYQLVKNIFPFELRGQIQIKGKGEMTVYTLSV